MENKTKLNSLQALRGIAAILVVLYHAYVFSDLILGYNFLHGFFKFGYAGVDLFFVLSGFIIFYTHHNDFGRIKQLKPYLIKRFLRIYPFYWAINLLVIPVYLFFPIYGAGYETEINTIISSLLLFPQSHFPIIAVAWTLVHEVRFYIIFGLIILFGFKRTLPIISFLVILTLINFYQGMVGNTSLSNNVFLNYIFSPYNLEFIFGCLAAYFVVGHNSNFRRIALYLGIIMFLSFASVYENLGISKDSVYRILAFGLPSAFIVFSLASYDLYQPIKIPRLLLFLGDASYSIYLTHYILISAIIRLFIYLNFDKYFGVFITIIISILSTIIISSLISIFIEKPLLSYSREKFLSFSKKSRNFKPI